MLTLLLRLSQRQQGPRVQRGQALPFTLAFAAVTGLVVLLLFNSSQLANTKTVLQNAADAGAYSAAVLQARDHNFSAYTNRAIIANQVAVAQFVSLKSYLDDAKETQNRIKSFPISFYEYFPTAKPIWDLGKRMPVSSAQSIVSKMAPIAVKGLDKLIWALETAQDLHHKTTLAEALLVADEVVKKNDPDASMVKGAFMVGVSLVQVKKWDGYTKRHPANTEAIEADRFAKVVVKDENSTDKFTRNRSGVPSPFWISPVRLCPGVSLTVFGFYHAGGTRLSRNKKHWLGLDATQGGGFALCVIPGTPPVTIFVPLLDIGGSGGALAGKNTSYDEGYKYNHPDSNRYGGARNIPPGILRYSKGPGSTLDAKGGLQDYYRDVADTKKTPVNQASESNSAPVITIEVERKTSTVRLSSDLLPDSENIRLDDKTKGKTMRTLASAQTYFYRPKENSSAFTRKNWRRNDGKTEMASLFSPYWQARLVDTPVGETALSFALQN